MGIFEVRRYFEEQNIPEEIREFDVSSATVELAAQALGVPGKLIAKTLSFAVGDSAILILAAGDARIDNKKYREAFKCKAKMLTPDEVLHFVFRPDLHQPWRGRGVRIQLRDVLQNLRQSAATTNSFLSDKWKPSVIVKVDALADEFAGIKGRRKLLDEYVAGQTAGEPWVIPSELMDVITVKPLSLADLAINDSVELDKRAVAAAFAVPPFLVGVGEYDQDAYNNFIQRTVIPIANGIAQELTKKLLVSTELYFKFNTRKLYAYDYETLAKIGDDQYVRGIMTGNEVRDWLDLSPKKGLNELVMLENYIPAGMIGQQKKLKEED